LMYSDQISKDIRDNGNQPLWISQMIEMLHSMDIHWHKLYEHEYGVLSFIFSLMQGKLLIDEVDPSDMKNTLLDNWSEFSQPDSEFINRQLKIFDGLQDNENLQFTKEQKVILSAYLLSTLDCVAKMYHGVSMYHLIQEGIHGNDKSLYKAIQVDPTILEITEIKDKLHTASINGDLDYLQKIASAQKESITHKSVRYPKLYVVFSILQPHLSQIDKYDLFNFIVSFKFYDGSDESSLIKLRDTYLKRVSRKWK